MKNTYLDALLQSNRFQFKKLHFAHIDNQFVAQTFSPAILEQETCLFHGEVEQGQTYFQILHDYLKDAMSARKPSAVVRFADGEYAFYRTSKECNGLYRQAESVSEIRRAIPFHLEALRFLCESGKLAPLIFPGNCNRPAGGIFSHLFRSHADASATLFLDFLHANRLELTGKNYLPFYVVYAYLVSDAFAALVDGKKICVVGSEFNRNECSTWFGRFSSRPLLSFVQIPDSYVATRWHSIRDGLAAHIPPDVDLFLAGAGVGALPVCVDLTRRFSVPAVDAGHVLNLMNGREDKSSGPRLFSVVRR